MTDKTEMTENWKTRSYIYGISIGTIVGFLSAYLFNRAAEEESDEENVRPQVKTTQMLSLGLAALGIVRQISEMGKPDKKK